MHRDLVGLPTEPEPSGLVVGEGPHRSGRLRRRQRGHELRGLLAEPGDQRLTRRRGGQRTAGDPLGRALLHHDASPLLHLPDVGDELGERPIGTRRHRRVEVGAFGHIRQGTQTRP